MGLTLLLAGCSIHTEKGLMVFGEWSIGVSHSAKKRRACRDEGCRQCGCQDDACMNGCAREEQVAEEEPVPPRAARQSGPPEAVHNRFHPVPTRPVFGGSNIVARERRVETLPQEYSNTPRLRSAPRAQVDPEELRQQEKAALGELKE